MGQNLKDRLRDPFADPVRSRTCSFLIPVIALLNILIFLITMLVNDCPQNASNCSLKFLGRASFQPMSENPLLGPSSSTLLKMGGLSSDLVAHSHQVWRLFTCIWLHAGLIHLFVNDLSLLVVGIRLEHKFGLVRIGSIYLLSGIGGSLLADIFLQHQISVGASASLFGLLGATLSDLTINWSPDLQKSPILILVALVAVVNLGIGIMPHADNMAHIGGFIFGFLLGAVLFIRPQFGWGNRTFNPPGQRPEITHTSKYTVYQVTYLVAAIVLLATGYVAGMVLVLRGVDANQHCSWCHYLSCVPTSLWKCDGNNGRATCKYIISGHYMFMRCENNQRTQLYYGTYLPFMIKRMCSKLCS